MPKKKKLNQIKQFKKTIQDFQTTLEWSENKIRELQAKEAVLTKQLSAKDDLLRMRITEQENIIITLKEIVRWLINPLTAEKKQPTLEERGIPWHGF